jgi:hypothetical protein
MADRISCVVLAISTSDGWNIVYSASGVSRFSEGSTSWIRMPSSPQPWDSATPSSSAAVSASVMYTTDSPRLARLHQKLKAGGGLAGPRLTFDQVDAVVDRKFDAGGDLGLMVICG